MASRIPYETSSKPWFGPRRRARELLDLRTKILPPKEAIGVIESVLGSAAPHIQRVRFIDYIHGRPSGFRYTIALMWTFSAAAVRQELYDAAEEIVKQTGWYPLPQGERIASRLDLREFYELMGRSHRTPPE